MKPFRRLWIVNLILILGLLLTSCAGGGGALQGEVGLDVELPGGEDDQGSAERGGEPSSGSNSLLWLLVVGAVFALTLTFFRRGPR